jgi:hypothetical protein
MGLTLYGAYHFASLVFPLYYAGQQPFALRKCRLRTHCRFWIKMNESTILPVERLLGAWARQSSGTRCQRRRGEDGSPQRTRGPTLVSAGLDRGLVPAAIFTFDFTIDPCMVTIDRWQVVLTYGNDTITQSESPYSSSATPRLVRAFKH